MYLPSVSTKYLYLMSLPSVSDKCLYQVFYILSTYRVSTKNDPSFFVNVKIYYYFVDGRKILPEAEILILSFEVKIYKKT